MRARCGISVVLRKTSFALCFSQYEKFYGKQKWRYWWDPDKLLLSTGMGTTWTERWPSWDSNPTLEKILVSSGRQFPPEFTSNSIQRQSNLKILSSPWRKKWPNTSACVSYCDSDPSSNWLDLCFSHILVYRFVQLHNSMREHGPHQANFFASWLLSHSCVLSHRRTLSTQRDA